jgi:hypothetical protein
VVEKAIALSLTTSSPLWSWHISRNGETMTLSSSIQNRRRMIP